MHANTDSNTPIIGPVNAAEAPSLIGTASAGPARFRWLYRIIPVLVAGAAGVYAHACGGIAGPDLNSLRSIDDAALTIWQRETDVGEGDLAGPDSTEAERVAARKVVGERAQLFVEHQRLKAGAASVAFGNSSALRLIRSGTRALVTPRRVEEGGRSRLVIEHSILTERQVQFDPTAPAARLFIPQVLDHRFDDEDPSGTVEMHVFPGGSATGAGVLRRRDAELLFKGTALSLARLPLRDEWVNASGGALTLSSSAQLEDSRCVGLYSDATNEFAAGSGDIDFDFRIAADEAGDRRPQVTWEMHPASVTPSVRIAAARMPVDCGTPQMLDWARADEANATLVAQPARQGWQCKLHLTPSQRRPENGVVIVRVSLPYPGCPSLEDTLSASR